MPEPSSDEILAQQLADTDQTLEPVGVAKLKTPDLTLAQIVAAVFASVEPVLTLLGVKLSEIQADAVDDLWKVAAGLLASDAVIRVGRAVGSR